MTRIVALAGLCLAVVAWAQVGGGGGVGNYPAGPTVQQDGTIFGDCPVLELPSASWGTPGVAGGICTLTPLGGGGGGVSPVLTFASCTPLDGTAQVYLGAGCADPNEPLVQARMKSSATFTDLSCSLSGSAGGSAAVTITARAGACGGLADASLTCAVSIAGTECQSASGSVSLTVGQCFALKVTSTASFSSPRALNCTMRRSA